MVTIDQVYSYVNSKGSVSTADILKAVSMPRTSIFRALKTLTMSGKLIKQGNRPHVIYRIAQGKIIDYESKISSLQSFIKQREAELEHSRKYAQEQNHLANQASAALVETKARLERCMKERQDLQQRLNQ